MTTAAPRHTYGRKGSRPQVTDTQARNPEKAMPQHFGYHPTPVREIPEQQGRQGIAGHPQKHRHLSHHFRNTSASSPQKPDTSLPAVWPVRISFASVQICLLFFTFCLLVLSQTRKKSPRLFCPSPFRGARLVSYFSGLTPSGFQRVFLRFRKSRHRMQANTKRFSSCSENFFRPFWARKKMG